MITFRKIVFHFILLTRGKKSLIQFCFHCYKVLGIVDSAIVGESGGICPRCLKKHSPDIYARLKDRHELTEAEIAQAEN